MLKNLLITSLRYIAKNAMFVGINILGLAIAIALCITAYLNTKYDMDWDKTHVNLDNIYKVNVTREIQDRQQEYGITPFALAPLMENEITGVEQICRYSRSYSPVKYDDKIFNKRIGYADENFCEIFTVEMIKGNTDALKQKNNVLISEQTAEAYFGNEDPLGKMISVFNDKDQEFVFVIGGVFKEIGLNSSFNYQLLTQIDNYIDMWEIDSQKWDSWVAATFLLIKGQNSIPSVNQQLEKYIEPQNSAREDWKITSFFVKSLKDEANSQDVWAHWLQRSFHPAAVSVPPIMAIFILIIAAFNFMNSAISFAGKRLKEIGLRKVFGGLRKHIIIQFLGENFLVSFMAVIVGIFLAGFLVPEYSAMWEYLDLEYNFFNNAELILFILALWVFTAVLAGAYPAFYISRFNPIKIFRDNLKIKGKNGLSKFLLGFQFFTSVMALFMGIMFAQNAVFQEKMDYGYDKDNIIVIGLHNQSDYKPFEQVVKAYPKIEKYAGTSYHIGYGNYNRSITHLDKKIETGVMHIGYDYLQTMGLKLEQGRLFNIENQASDVAENNIVVNEKFVHDFSFKEPLGKTVYVNDTTALNIIGVVNDVYLYGAWSDIDPLIYRLAPESEYQTFAIRASKENMNDVNEYLRTQWAELIPNYPYEGRYQVELMNEAKVVNQNIKVMFVFLAICALFLSAIGLYTLVSLNVLNRTKEIGVRKVNGASVSRIMLIITRPFAILVLITSVLGCFAGKYATLAIMDSVWDVFTKPNVLSYLLPVLIILVTAAVTIIWKVYKAASVNPTVSLRYE